MITKKRYSAYRKIMFEDSLYSTLDITGLGCSYISDTLHRPRLL